MTSTYPPEPWYLGGALHVSVFLVPVSDLPASFARPRGRRLLRIGRRAIVGVAAVRYVPGGALEYDELLVSVPTVGRGGARITIPQIWVDSPASRQGGREMWGIPKELADFQRTGRGQSIRMRMSVDERAVAGLHASRGLPLLPGMRQLALPILQHLDGRRFLSHNRVIGRLSGLRATWRFAADGPLAFLRGRRPLMNVEIHDASIVFGMDVSRSEAGSDD